MLDCIEQCVLPQDRAPWHELRKEPVHVDIGPGPTKPFELLRTFFQQASATFGVPLFVMVKRGGDLNQPVEKGLLITLRSEPNSFQGFVGLEKLLRVEEPNALGDARFHAPVLWHTMGLRGGDTGRPFSGPSEADYAQERV